jgi:outer membrane lipoprotein-sorting protein
MFPRALIGLLALAVAGSALADARQDLHTAYEHNLKVKSYRATMLDLTSNRQMSVVEFQAPDRYRVTAPGRPPSLMIGDSMYMDMHGKVMKIPLPRQMLGQYRNEAAMKDLEKGAPVESLGAGLVGKEPARKYRFRSAAGQPDSTSTVWVGVRSGNVLQVETSGKNAGRPFAMRVLYSDFNSPSIRIDPPR